MGTCLQDLSTELLIQIFAYCNIRDLYQLQKTCAHFYNIIDSATGLGNTVPLLVTNQLRQEIQNRTTRLLTLREKCRISYNWKNGMYEERQLLKTKNKFIPWLVLTKDCLWHSQGSKIHAYKRKKKTLDVAKPYCTVESTNSPADVCKFVYKHNYLVSGQQDGSLLIWQSKNNSVCLQNCHEADINAVDLENNIVVSGSKDRYIKMWMLNTELEGSPKPISKHDMHDRVWSTAFSNGGEYLAVGTAGLNYVAPLHIFDVNRQSVLQELGPNFRKGSGILQMKWEGPFIMLSCGYDKLVRKWDLRTGGCEQLWEDPFYSTVYCFDTDNYCSILTGTESHGRTVLWDMRARNYVQMYFMETCKKAGFSSPIYSLSFDVHQLFAATDRCLNILDFSVKSRRPRNYSNLFGVTSGAFLTNVLPGM